MNIKSSGIAISTGVLSAIAASLCCVVPVVALLAGTSSMASSFSWLEPARPYLISFSVAFLAFAWYQKLTMNKTNDMDCCEPKKASFFQSKLFLTMVTLFTALMMTFPLYAKIFYPKPKTFASTIVTVDNKRQVKFTIQGMTCTGCETEVNAELAKVAGVLDYKTSYPSKSSIVSFDNSKVDVKAIVAAISNTGYKVKGYEFLTAATGPVTFYEVPLVCNAAPTIGCGSRSKPALLELEKNAAVKEAWMNRPGTVIAIVWKDKPQTETVAIPIFEENNIEYTQLSEEEAASHKKTFTEGKEWLRGGDVDKLSIEEAGTIAESAVKFGVENKLMTKDEAKKIKKEIEEYFKVELVKIRTKDQLNEDSENKFVEDMLKIAEKYIGKERAQKAMELYQKSCEEKCEPNGGCKQPGSKKNCCDQ
jgi:copper chaperone CopZ